MRYRTIIRLKFFTQTALHIHWITLARQEPLSPPSSMRYWATGNLCQDLSARTVAFYLGLWADTNGRQCSWKLLPEVATVAKGSSVPTWWAGQPTWQLDWQSRLFFPTCHCFIGIRGSDSTQLPPLPSSLHSIKLCGMLWRGAGGSWFLLSHFLCLACVRKMTLSLGPGHQLSAVDCRWP